MTRRQKFDYKLYKRMAEGIHRKFCDDREWCIYGQPVPAGLEDDINLPSEERQARAVKRFQRIHNCQAAVDAENIAAHIQFGKGAKVRKFKSYDDDYVDE